MPHFASAAGPTPGPMQGPGLPLGPMPTALLIALAAHLLILLGIGFEAPEPGPPEPRLLELISVEQSASVAATPLADAPVAQIDRAGETSVPLSDVAPGTDPLAATPPDRTVPAVETRPAEPGPLEPPTEDAEPLQAAPEPEQGPPTAGTETAPLTPERSLLTPSSAALTELMTSMKPDIALPSVPSVAPPPASALRANAADVFASRSAEIAALTERIGEQRRNRSGRARRKAISTRTKEYRYASYMEAWRRKVERIGNLNYPSEARELGLFGSLILHVAVRADGSLEAVRVVRSSGHDVLDEAAIAIVRLAAPFAPFPDDIARETDVLDITRVWQFQRDHRLGWDN